jgi:CubicO group peptidase (beta-lactamase class C family)
MRRCSANWLTTTIIVLLCQAQTMAQAPLTVGDDSQLLERFGEQAFWPRGGFVLRVGDKLPELVWQHPELVARVVANPHIPTRWFNAKLEEINVAELKSLSHLGRYYVYGEAPSPSGPPLRAAMTCYCIGADLNLNQLAEKHQDAAPIRDSQRDSLQDIVHHWQTTEEGVIELGGLLELPPNSAFPRKGQWLMENATQHVRLKRKLMGLTSTPIVSVAARPRAEAPAAVLRNAPLDTTGISAAEVQALEGKLEQWFAATSEPMAVVVACNGVIVTSKAFGTLDEKMVTVDTPMRLDSAMKPLMAVQLAMFVDRGILQLDEPIGKYLPDFNREQDRDLTFRAGHVHATGIYFPWDLAFSRLFYFHTWHESLIVHCKREWSPGTKYRYGVVGVILSVRAIELLRGRNYWDAMERDLFEPLGIRNVLPGGTGFSAESMARIGVLLDNRGSYGKWELFSEETSERLLPTSLKPYFPSLDLKYGIGLQDRSKLLGHGSFGHGGGCGTQLIVNPEKHLVFAMVRNAPGKDFQKHLSEVTAMMKAWCEE